MIKNNNEILLLLVYIKIGIDFRTRVYYFLVDRKYHSST